MVAAGVLLLLPALLHGASLGPFDWLSGQGLSSRSGVVVHNRQTFDQITEMVPWGALDWTQVHSGHLPLWNPYEALGMPLAFNWQSAPFGLSTLISYLFPLRLAFTVCVVSTIAIAGTGVYVLSRMLRLGVIGAVTAATVFELSGPFVAWLGWPLAGVTAWSGWLFAAALAVVRGRRRVKAITAFALATAAATYAGQPEALVLLAFVLLVFVAALLLLRIRSFGGNGPILRPALDTVVGTVAGAALAAPLLLPGVELLSRSVRTSKAGNQALPLGAVIQLTTQGYDGLPVAGSHFFGPSFYLRTAVYLGVIALALAVVGAAVALKYWRARPGLVALLAVLIVATAFVFVPALDALFGSIPRFGDVLWRREALLMAMAFAVLAGAGADIVIDYGQRSRLRAGAAASFLAAGVVVLVWWAVGRGD
ncbi:MAG: hypothetical protein ACRD6W_13495, partial [Nitrososphaerales archaeon]